MESVKSISITDAHTGFSEPAKKLCKKVANVDCWLDTLRISETIPPPPPSVKISYDTMTAIVNMPATKSQISVVNQDTIECALSYEKPLILNLADDIYPGGWVNVGSNAQEESLFRRTNYHLTLTKDLYPISETDVIYSPNVTVIKRPDFGLYETPRILDFIACPAIKYPLLEEDDTLCEEDREILEQKIQAIIHVAIKYGHKTIVFGAMGCGAWQNPARDVATIFKRVLEIHDGMVENYVFAILDDIETDSDGESAFESDAESESNYEIFRKILEDKME